MNGITRLVKLWIAIFSSPKTQFGAVLSVTNVHLQYSSDGFDVTSFIKCIYENHCIILNLYWPLLTETINEQPQLVIGIDENARE